MVQKAGKYKIKVLAADKGLLAMTSRVKKLLCLFVKEGQERLKGTRLTFLSCHMLMKSPLRGEKNC